MSTRVLISIVVGALVALLVVRFVQAQAHAPEKRRHGLPPPYVHVQDKAKAARNNDPAAVRALTDEIFYRSMLSVAAPSLKERLFKTELAFRQGRHPWILPDTVVTVVNGAVRDLKLPGYMRLTQGQLQMVRKDLRYFVRDFAFSDPTQGDATPEMSPAEAVFVLADLAMQKLMNQEYQVEPEQWERTALLRRARSRSGDVAPAPPEARETLRFVKTPIPINPKDLSDEGGIAVQSAHMFLDQLGFQR